MNSDYRRAQLRAAYHRRKGSHFCVDCQANLTGLHRNRKRCDGCDEAERVAREKRYRARGGKETKILAERRRYQADPERYRRKQRELMKRLFASNPKRMRQIWRDKYTRLVIAQQPDGLLREMRALLLSYRRRTWGQCQT